MANFNAFDEAKKLFNKLGQKVNPTPFVQIRNKLDSVLPQVSQSVKQTATSTFGDIRSRLESVLPPVQASRNTQPSFNQPLKQVQQFVQPLSNQIQNAYNPILKQLPSQTTTLPAMQALQVAPSLMRNATPKNLLPQFTSLTGKLLQKTPTLEEINKPFGKAPGGLPMAINFGLDTIRSAGNTLDRAGQGKLLKGDFMSNLEDIGNLAMVLPVGRLTSEVPKINSAAQYLSKTADKESIKKIADFVIDVQKTGGKKNYGELGQDMASVAKDLYGRSVENLDNKHLANLLDATLQQIGKKPNRFSLGLAVDDIRAGSKELNPEQLAARAKLPGIMYESRQERVLGNVAKRRINPALEGKHFVEEMLQESKAVKDPQNITQPFNEIVDSTFNDVKKKVNAFDYLRTPNRVLEKIGLGNEAKLLRQKYDDYLQDLPKEIDKITQWSKQVDQRGNVRIFNYLDGKLPTLDNPTELKVATEIKDYLKDWAYKLKLPEDKQISSYITHLFPKGAIEKEFDPEIAKLIRGKVVGSVYDPFLQRRAGMPEYIQDTWQALDAYTKRATRKFHMDQALEKVAAKAENLPEESYNYVKQHIARINMQPTQIDTLLDNMIKSSPVGYKMGQRPVTSITQKARQAVFRGLLGLNPASALRNIQQSTNTYAMIGEKDFGLGLMKTLQNMPRYAANMDTELEKVGVLGKDIIQDRTVNATHKFWENADKTLFYLFNQAEKFNRSVAYFGAKSKALGKGMDEQKAIEYAKDIVGRSQFNYDVLDTPAALQSDLAKTLGQFAKYPLAQTEFLTEMVKRKDIAGSVRWLASNLLFIATAGQVLGLKPQDMFPQFRFGVPPTLQLPFEAGKAAINAPDQYGNTSDEQNPIKRIMESTGVQRGALNYVPAGGQLRKSFEAGKAMIEGGSFTPSGQLRFEVKPSVKTALLGIWSTKEGQDYLDKRMGNNLSEPEQQAKEFNKQQTEADNEEQRLGSKIYLQLKNLKTPEERKQLLDTLDQQNVLSEGLRREIKSNIDKEKESSQGSYAKATRHISTNEGKATFLVTLFQNKSVQERRKILMELDQAGILTDDLRKKIREQILKTKSQNTGSIRE